MIAGLGNDITDCGRIKQMMRKFGDLFLDHLLTPKEKAESKGRFSYCAGRWAAKEAVSKALGCGIGGNCAFTDIEIIDNESGKPEVKLSGAAELTAKRLKVDRIHLSISHERHYAVATVILESD